jgi:ankyrin repeat protein
MNLIDYFTEKWNEKRSDGSRGLKKPFIFETEKVKKINEMNKNFPHSINKHEYSAFRYTAPQILKQSYENKVIYNKRKLNKLIHLVNLFDSKGLSFDILISHLYQNPMSPDNFFLVLLEYSFDKKIFIDNNGNLNFILPACYYGHIGILKWLLKDNKDMIDVKNCCGQTGLHLGKLIKF